MQSWNADRTPVIDAELVLDLARKLVRIPSENPPGNEFSVAEFLVAYFREQGVSAALTQALPGRPNVVVRFEGAEPGPHLILDGHSDVVPAGGGWTVDPYAAVVHDGRLYGRGAADMKGGVAAMIAAALAVRRNAPFRGSMTLAVVSDEEEGGSGTRQLVRDGLQGDWAIIPEPTDLKPIIAHKGDFYFDITLRGVAAHGSVPHRGVNAIYKAGKLLGAVEQLNEALAERVHPLVGKATISVGTIRGGETTCMVPAECRVTVDRRVLPAERTDEVVAEIRAMLDDLARGDPDFASQFTSPVQVRPMETEPDLPVVAALRRATEQVLGHDPGIHGWSATCDASILADEGKTPAVIFGPGSIDHAAHRPDESVAVQELVQAAQIYVLAILELLGPAC